MESDDRRRPKYGVVVSLLDEGGGTSRVVMDDVSSGQRIRETSWAFELFYTLKRYPSSTLDDMDLSRDEFAAIGEALMARLLALNGRA